MKRLLLAVLVLFILVIGVAALLGWLLPEQHVVSRSVTLAASPEQVWQLISDVQDQPKWRKELKSVTMLPDYQPPNQPPHPDRQRLPGVAQENLCEALSGSGDAVEAIPHCQAALAIYRSQAAADSHDLQPVEDMASGLTNLSRALDRAHQPGKALEVARSARKLCEQALTQDPDSLDLVQENADSLIGLASLYQQLGTRMQAQSALRDGKAALAALTRRFPHTHMFSDLQAETTRLEISLH